jgi:CubicO group peptidase (beta-lactamase class C family)
MTSSRVRDSHCLRTALCLLACVACSRPQAGPHAGFDGIAKALERGDAPKTTSVLVMRGDAVLYEQYFNGATSATLHNTRSATKSLTALAVGIALDRHVLPGLDAPAFAYLADLAPFAGAGPLKDAITLEDLLTMSSALDCNDDDDNSPGNEEKMYPQQVWARFAVDIPVRGDYQRDATGRGPFHYCTAGVFLLGQIVQRAAKQPIDQFMATYLFAPLGITKWEFPRSPTGEVMTGGGLVLSSRDLATLARLVRDAGKAGTTQVVPAAFMRAATTVHRDAFPGQDYGYLFWHRVYKASCASADGWFMGGNGGNAIIAFPSLDAVVVITRTNYNTKGMHQQTIKLVEEQILPALACAK